MAIDRIALEGRAVEVTDPLSRPTLTENIHMPGKESTAGIWLRMTCQSMESSLVVEPAKRSTPNQVFSIVVEQMSKMTLKFYKVFMDFSIWDFKEFDP